MIDISTEAIVSFPEYVRQAPERRGGKKLHVCTLYRWSTRGCRGRVLETIQIGGQRCTSMQALQRFFDGLSANTEAAPTPAFRTPNQRRRDIERAKAKLTKMGV